MKAAFIVLALVALFVVFATANKDRYEEYANLVEKTNAAQNLWKAELNTQVIDDYTTIKNMLGDLSVGSVSNQLEEKTSGWSVELEDLPDHFMAYEKWPECAANMRTVHDQSACGSCWAVSVAAAASERHCIASKNPSIFLSSRDLLSCCTSCGFGCNGGYPSSAWSWISSQGLPTGSPDSKNNTMCVRYPFLSCMHHTDGEPQCSDYDFDTPSCQKSCDSDSLWPTKYEQDKIKFSRAYSVRGEANIMKELYENGPVSLSYTVYQDFMNYKSGIYRHVDGQRLGGHAVTLEGWGVDAATGTKYWVVKNNWNNKWAEQGYFRIIRGIDDCGCESGINAGQ